MKKQVLKSLFTFLLSTGITSVVHGQHWLASVSGSGTEFSGEYKGNHLAVDASGNTYTTGSYRSSTTVSTIISAYSSGETGVSGTAAFSLNNALVASKENSFVAKTDINGKFTWALGIGSTATTTPLQHTKTNSIAVDNANNVYVGGFFNGTINYFSTAFPGVTSINATDANDGLVLKLSTNGVYQWHKVFGGDGDQVVTGVTSDASGNLYVIGTFTNSLTINGVASALPASTGSTDVFVAKFNSTGTLQYIKSFGGTSVDVIWALATDSDNSIYVSGSFTGSMVVKPDDASTEEVDETISLAGPIATAVSSYVVKLDASGNAVWAKVIKSSGLNVGHGIAVDFESTLTNRGVYLTGNVSNDVTEDIDFAGVKVALSNGSLANPYVAKLNAASGAGIWAKVFKAENSSTGYLITVNSNKEVFAAGYARSIDFDGTSFTSANDNGYILKINSNNGSVFERKLIVTSGSDRVNGLVATNSAVYVNGIASGPSGSATSNFAETGQDFAYRGGSWDVYILKWGSTTLPVSFSEFTGKSTSKGVLLSWGTLSETNNQYFDLERSIDGLNFSSINALAAAGTSTGKQSYSYLDANPSHGVNYYRLKQVDTDGSYSYFPRVIAINNQLEMGALKLYPNPGSGMMNIQLPSEAKGANLKIYDQSGRLVKSYSNISGNSQSVDISEQPTGVYFIQITERGKSDLIKYLKQ